MAKFTAKGYVHGKFTVITCAKESDTIAVFQDGKRLNGYDNLSFELYSRALLNYIDSEPCSYVPAPDTLEAYWLVLLDEYFDEPPEIIVEGELDTFGSPYSDEDIGDAVF